MRLTESQLYLVSPIKRTKEAKAGSLAIKSSMHFVEEEKSQKDMVLQHHDSKYV